MEVSLVGLCVVVGLTVSIGVALVVGFLLGLLYSKSYRDGSEKTGERKWPSFQHYVRKVMNVFMRNLFSYKVVFYSQKEELEVFDIVNQNTEQVIFAASPHGLFPISSFFHVITPFLESDIRWDTVKPFTHYLLFALPFLREVGLWLGLMDASRENILTTMKNHSIYVSLGGAREMMSNTIETKHKGLLRLAYRNKKRVFPVIHKGQERVFHCYTFPWLDVVRSISLDFIGYPLPTFFTMRPSALTTYIYPACDPKKYHDEEVFIENYYRQIKFYENSL